MIRIFSILIAVLTFNSCAAQNTFTLNGKIDGQAEGMKVYLEDADYLAPKRVDTTFIKNGEFTFKGSLKQPGLYKVIIDKTIDGEPASERNWLSSTFYLENSTVEYKGHIDSLPTYFYNSKRTFKKPIITGSKTQDMADAFEASNHNLREELRDIDKKYQNEYHLPSMDDVFNTARGIELINQQKALQAKMNEANLKFIQENPSSVLAYDKAMVNFLGMYVELSIKEIDQLVSMVEKGWKGTEKFEAFKALAEKAKATAVGVKYQNFELLTPDGKKVMLSDYVKDGQFVMLEFWASWCGPCRGEIPHLREVFAKYKDKGFNIVSISIDESDAAWKKAMKEENMVWTQLNDPKGFEGEISKAYNILGIPYAILLDKEGNIFKFDMRGASLDAVLANLYD